MNLKQKRIIVSMSLVVLAVIVVGLFTIKLTVTAPGNTRVILDRTQLTYTSPPCFQQAKLTNNIADSTLSRAAQLAFKPDSICTEKSLGGIQQSLLTIVLEKLSISKGRWEW